MSAEFITILHGGTPKLYYVIYEQPLTVLLRNLLTFSYFSVLLGDHQHRVRRLQIRQFAMVQVALLVSDNPFLDFCWKDKIFQVLPGDLQLFLLRRDSGRTVWGCHQLGTKLSPSPCQISQVLLSFLKNSYICVVLLFLWLLFVLTRVSQNGFFSLKKIGWSS